jgi:hypothetical protein
MYTLTLYLIFTRLGLRSWMAYYDTQHQVPMELFILLDESVALKIAVLPKNRNAGYS